MEAFCEVTREGRVELRMKAKGKRGAGEGEASLLLLVEWREPWREEAKGWAREHGPLTVGLRKQERRNGR